MSISNSVSELISYGFITEIGTTNSKVGRKPILLDVSAVEPLFASVQITRFFIGVGIVDCKGDSVPAGTHFLQQ